MSEPIEVSDCALCGEPFDAAEDNPPVALQSVADESRPGFFKVVVVHIGFGAVEADMVVHARCLLEHGEQAVQSEGCVFPDCDCRLGVEECRAVNRE